MNITTTKASKLTLSYLTRVALLPLLLVLFVIQIFLIQDVYAQARKAKWNTVKPSSLRFDRNGDSANISVVNRRVQFEMLSDTNQSVVAFRNGLAKKVTAVNIRYKLQGCATTPVATQLSFAMGTRARGKTIVAGTHVIDHQSRKFGSLLTSFTEGRTSESVLAENYWNMRFLLPTSAVDITSSFNRSSLKSSTFVQQKTTGKRKEGTTTLQLPSRLGAKNIGFVIFSPILEQGLNDECTIILTKIRAFY